MAKKIDSSLESIDRIGSKLSYRDFKDFFKEVADAFPSGTEEYEFLTALLNETRTDTAFCKKLFGLLEEEPRITDDAPYGFSWELMAPSETGRAVFKKMEELDRASANDLYAFMSYTYMNYTSAMGRDEKETPAKPEAEPAPEPAKEEPPAAFRPKDIAPEEPLEESAPPAPSPKGFVKAADEGQIAKKVQSYEELSSLFTDPLALGMDQNQFDKYLKLGPIYAIQSPRGLLAWHPEVGFVDKDDNILDEAAVKAALSEEGWAALVAEVPELAALASEGGDLNQSDTPEAPVHPTVDAALNPPGLVRSSERTSYVFDDLLPEDKQRAQLRTLLLAQGYVSQDISEAITQACTDCPDSWAKKSPKHKKAWEKAARAYLDNAGAMPDTDLGWGRILAAAVDELAEYCEEVRKTGNDPDHISAAKKPITSYAPRTPEEDKLEARIQTITKQLKIGDYVMATRDGFPKPKMGQVQDIKINYGELASSTIAMRWSDGTRSEIPMKNVQRLLYNSLADSGAKLAMISSAREANGKVSFVLTGFKPSKVQNAYTQVFCGRTELTAEQIKSSKICTKTRLYSGKKLAGLFEALSKIEGGSLIAQSAFRYGKTFVSEKAAVIVKSGPYGMFAYKVPVVFVKSAKHYELFKKIGSAYISESGHRFQAIKAAKYGRPKFLMVAQAKETAPLFATTSKITCNAMQSIERTQFILQRKAVHQAVVAQKKANAIVSSKLAAAEKKTAEAITQAKALETTVANQKKANDILSARIIEGPAKEKIVAESQKNEEAARSSERVAFLASRMSGL